MKRWNIFKTIKLLLVMAALLFIWGHSAMDAFASSAESERFLALVRPLVEAVQRLLAQRGLDMDPSVLVRKMAHFGEYAVLGVLTYLLFASPGRTWRIIPPGVLCLAAAAVDEGIQHFSAGRAPSLRDVGIDCCGACCGVLLAAVIVTLIGLSVRSHRAEKA